MNKIGFLIICLLVFYSCNTTPKLAKDLACDKTKKLNNSSYITDVNNNFSLFIPTYWKSNFYFDDLQSSISTADTTRSLIKTTIIEATFYSGKINFKPSFLELINRKITDTEGLKITSKRKEIMHNKPAYWLLATGNKKINEIIYPYQLLLIYLKTSPKSYVTYATKIYGKDSVNYRFCKSFHIFNSLKLLE